MADAGIDNVNIYGSGSFARGGPYQAILRNGERGKYFEFRNTEAPTSCGSDHGKIAEICRHELTARSITDPEEEFLAVFALGLVNKR